MSVITKHVQINSKGENDVTDLTDRIQKSLSETSFLNGIVTIFVIGSTGALTTIEYEPGLVRDFPAMLERIAPKEIAYQHERMWHDDNGHSHVRASLIGPSLVIPFVEGRLALGTWQQIIFIELDTRPRSREILLQIIGEK